MVCNLVEVVVTQHNILHATEFFTLKWLVLCQFYLTKKITYIIHYFLFGLMYLVFVHVSQN